MPCANEKTIASVANDPPTAISQALRASERFILVATAIAIAPAIAKPRNQAPCPPSASFSSRNGPLDPPNGPAVPRGPPGPPAPPPGPPAGPATGPSPL